METPNFSIRMSPDILARVDEWRKRQTVPPSRAAAVRWLVEHGLVWENLPAPDDTGNPGLGYGETADER